MYIEEDNQVKRGLMYPDIMEALLPFSDYVLVAASLARSPGKQTCSAAKLQLFEQGLAATLAIEISALGRCYQELDGLTGSSLHVGGLLWRLLDRNHDNRVSPGRLAELASQFSIQANQDQFEGFVNWHFRSHRDFLCRDDLMTIFNLLMKDKRRKSLCNFERFVQDDACRKRREIQLQQQQQIEHIIQERVRVVVEGNRAQCRAPSKLGGPSPAERVLKGKAGYGNPTGLIKSCTLLE